MQVYASYKYRRDLADAARIPGFLSRSRPLRREEAARQEVLPRPARSSRWGMNYESKGLPDF